MIPRLMSAATAKVSLHRDHQSATQNLDPIGLQCHTAPYAWKVLFESQQQIYEIILCACSIREEEQWKSRLIDHAAQGTSYVGSGSTFLNLLSCENSMLCLDIQSLGPVFGQSGSLIRRKSIQRAATVNSRKIHCQVIIKNTFSTKESIESPVSRLDSINRSHTLMSTSRVPTLAPRRIDRQRMEQALAEVWTENLLPYPGMTCYRSGQLLRSSANSLIRKLSMASITSGTSTKYSRTASTTGSFTKQRKVTYGSIERSSPYVVQAGGLRENQTDGAASSELGDNDAQPDADLMDLDRHELTVTAERSIESTDSSMVYVTKVGTLSEASHDNGVFDAPEASDMKASQGVKFMEPVRARSSQERRSSRKHKRLLKALSTENMRKWFH